MLSIKVNAVVTWIVALIEKCSKRQPRLNLVSCSITVDSGCHAGDHADSPEQQDLLWLACPETDKFLPACQSPPATCMLVPNM